MRSYSLQALVKEFAGETERVRGQRLEGLAVQGQIPGLDTERVERPRDVRGDCNESIRKRPCRQVNSAGKGSKGCLQRSDRRDDSQVVPSLCVRGSLQTVGFNQGSG